MKSFIATFCFLSSVCEAQWFDINQFTSKLTAKNIYEISGKQIQKESNIAKLKYYESSRQWENCLKAGQQLKGIAAEMQIWVTNSLLHCLDEAQNFKSPVFKRTMDQARTSLLKKTVDEVDAINDSEFKIRYLRLKLQNPTKTSAKLSAKQAIAELKDLEDLFLVLKNSDVSDKAILIDRMRTLAKQAKDEKWMSYLSDEKRTPAANTKNEAEITAPEQQASEKLEQVYKAKDLKLFLELVVKYFNDYPGGADTKKWNTRLASALDDFKFSNREIEAVKGLDASRRAELASALFKRQEYLLVTKLLSAKADSSLPALSLLARSYHFTGQYDEATQIYQDLLTKYSAAEEVYDLRLKYGLTLLRQEKFDEAIRQFDWLGRRSKNDLAGLYWKFVLQKKLQQADAAKQTADAILSKYPFSYYGLRVALLQGKSLDKILKVDAPIKERKKIWVLLTKNELRLLHRVKALAAAGWTLEVQRELQSLRWDSNPDRKLAYSQLLVKLQQFPQAVKQVNESMDLDPSFRSANLLKSVYPTLYEKWVLAEASRYKFSSKLVFSLIRQESAFGLKAVSTSNAMGLMQMIPPTAQEIASALKLDVKIPDDMYLPEINIPMGTWYMAQVLKTMRGNVPAMLAGYNAGPSKIDKFFKSRRELDVVFSSPSSDPIQEVWFDELPWSETMFYVKAILRNFILYSVFDAPKVQFDDPIWSSSIVK